MKRKNLLILFALFSLIALFYLYIKLFSANTGDFKDKKYLFVKTGSDYNQLKLQLMDSHLVENIKSFEWVADKMNLKSSIHPGRYELQAGMGNFKMISMLKAGKQKPVRLVINKLRTKKDIIRKISTQLEADSHELQKLFSNPDYLKKWDIDTNQIQCAIIPATYEFYWNTSADKAFEKIAKSYEQFWTSDRKVKAQQLNLTIPQVITIASIVEEETNMNDEKARIASVYLNRYKIGMKLGADPTVKFAVGDFGLRRILNIHTQFASPYNTYYITGLPPGPICTPSSKSIEAVLNPESTNYLFFCAKEDFSGHHNFASNYTDHLSNARKYQQALDKRGIK